MSSTPVPCVAGTVAQAFEYSLGHHGERDWLLVLPEAAREYGIAARTWRYAEAAVEVARLRTLYAEAGYGHGHRAGLLLHNRPEFLLHWLALNGLGVSVVPLNADWRSTELEFVIGHSEIVVAACSPERTVELAAAARAVGRPLAIVDPGGGAPARAHAAPPRARAAADAASECALLYTSGTTGRPKGCILSNEYFLWAGQWYATIGGLCEIRTGVERMITPLPMTHMNAMAYSAMCMMQTGGCLVLLDRFHPRSWWHSVRESRATIMHYLGVMPAMLLGAAPGAGDREHALRFGFGAGVNPRHHAAFEQRFGVPLLEAWAMTETGAGAVVIANREPRHVGSACFGRAAAGIEVRIVNDAGCDTEAAQPGELLVRRAGAQPRFGFFDGYLKDAAATVSAWEGGWFHTGDLVTRDQAGDLRFVDRKKNVIRRSGENISALEVEGVLGQHAAVAAAGVSAVPDAMRGDEVFATIVLRDAAAGAPEVVAQDLVRWCRERLAYFKTPGYIAFRERLPLTYTEKIQRSDLKRLGESLCASGQCFDLRALKRRAP